MSIAGRASSTSRLRLRRFGCEPQIRLAGPGRCCTRKNVCAAKLCLCCSNPNPGVCNASNAPLSCTKMTCSDTGAKRSVFFLYLCDGSVVESVDLRCASRMWAEHCSFRGKSRCGKTQLRFENRFRPIPGIPDLIPSKWRLHHSDPVRRTKQSAVNPSWTQLQCGMCSGSIGLNKGPTRTGRQNIPLLLAWRLVPSHPTQRVR